MTKENLIKIAEAGCIHQFSSENTLLEKSGESYTLIERVDELNEEGILTITNYGGSRYNLYSFGEQFDHYAAIKKMEELKII